MLVIPLFQHCTAITITLILRRQTFKFYGKESFVCYSMEIMCTSLRFSNDYSYSLLIDLAVRTAWY